MPQVTDPLCVTGAVVLKPEGSDVIATEFLGTAFLISFDILMTARHVLEPVSIPDGLRLAVVFTEPKLVLVDLAEIWLHPRYDIGFARLATARLDYDVFDVTWFDPFAESDVMAFDFSATLAKSMQPDGSLRFELIANFQKGNILRTYTAYHGPRYPTRSVDISFPAFKGASGAPVIDCTSRRVCGMLVGNLERHLMPAQLEEVRDQTGEVAERRRYFLPVGQAIHWSVLGDAIRACPIAPDEAAHGGVFRPKPIVEGDQD